MRTFTCPPSRRTGQVLKNLDWLVKPGRPFRQSVRTTGHRCLICDRWFFSNHIRQRFCTWQCWCAWLRAHSRRSVCQECKQEFAQRKTPRGIQVRCSRRCYGLSIRGPAHPRWKHGKYVKPKPVEIVPEGPVRKRFARRKRHRAPISISQASLPG